MTGTLSTLERLVGGVLRIGTISSGAMLGAGLIGSFLAPDHRVTRMLLGTGLLVLLLTPVARVVVSFLDYLWTRDWWFALWTGIVLALLASAFIAVFHA